MDTKKHWLHTTITVLILLGITTALYLYTSGYRLSRPEQGTNTNIDFKRTGLISARSIPEGANVYVNGILYTATNGTISALDPGIYRLKIVKKGYFTWEKDVEVFAELATDITAVLVAQSTRLEPLTNTGARIPVVSPTLSKLAFFSKDGEESGIWIMPLSSTGVSLFRSEPYVAIQDTYANIYSNGKAIEWSPDEDELLITSEDDRYFLVDIGAGAIQPINDPQTIRLTWEQKMIRKRSDFIERLDIPQEIVELALNPASRWSPDEKKFLYTVENNDNNTLEYRVYNLEKPLPVGEKIDNLVFTTEKEAPQPKITWYADSYHLILTENFNQEINTGVISLIRIDGTNKVEFYNGAIYSDNVYSTPGGDKVIILTTLNATNQTNLYTVGIR